MLKEVAKTEEVTLQLSDESSCVELLSRLQTEIPELSSLLDSCVVAINGNYVGKHMGVPAGAEIAILPPVSGG